MQFVIEELVGLADITAMPACAEVTQDLVEAVLGEAGKFAAEVLDPLNRSGDQQGAQLADGKVTPPAGFAEAYKQFTDAGWNSLSGPTEFGGQGLPHIVAMAVQEMWNSANMAFCLCPMLTSGVIEALKLRGSPEQKQHYMSKLVAGEWSGTMNLTEPQAGSDLSAVRTRAVPEGAHYRIYGTKIFITWGEHDMARNIVHLVLARTPDAPEGVKGISLFIVPKYLLNAHGSPGARNDVKCVSIEHKMGIHASPTCVMSYGEGEGAVGYLVGEENRGLEYMFIMMNHARLGVGLEGVAIAERAYQHARDYAKTRVQGRAIGQKSGDRVTIINHPDVRRMLLTMKAQVEAMRALAYTASAALDKAKHHPDDAERKRNQAYVDLLIPIVKGWCTEQAIEVASTGVQIHGGMGFIEETGAAQYLRDARITAIYEGTTGIQAADLVGRKIGYEKGATAAVVIAQMRRLISALAQNANADVAAQHDALVRGVDALAHATKWVVDKFPQDPNAVAAVSVPYLKLWGIVAGGWLMARAAEISAATLASGAGDVGFCKTKIATARFYVEHILPQAVALAEEIIGGAASVLAVSDAQF
jgi:alkylation response protein AidB-like acyl-CoA dehydrogenase